MMGDQSSPLWRRLARRANREEGATLVEAAFATPIFMLLVLAILEFGMVMNNHLAVSASVRAGARTVSASGNMPNADLYTLLNIGREGAALNRDRIEHIVIYKSGSYGEPPSDGCKAGIPQPGECNVYRAADLNRAAVQVAEETRAREDGDDPNPNLLFFGDCVLRASAADCSWDPTTRDVSISDGGTDHVGVYMKFEHRWVTGMFGQTATIEDESVIRLEPRSSV